MNSPQANIAEIERAAALFLPAGKVIEVRVPKTREGTLSGYFDDPAKLAAAAKILDGKAAGVYYTMNSVKPALLSRANNRIKSRAEQTTSDNDIVTRDWLLLDLDAKRPAGISSSDAEHETALTRAQAVREHLRSAGWPDPIFADSGNGAHLLYGLPGMANTSESTEMVKRSLQALAKRFDDAECQIDQTVFNAARIAKLYGTVARKGDCTEERPHRLAHIIGQPEAIVPVTVEQLSTLAAEAIPEPQPKANEKHGQFDVVDWAAKHGLTIHRTVPHDDGVKHLLDRCPYNPDHRTPDSAIFVSASGKIGFKCFHASCVSQGWKELREYLEPKQRQQSELRADDPIRVIPKPERKQLQTTNAFELLNSEYEEVPPIIERLLNNGLTIFAARPKIGKSWWALQIAIAMVKGGLVGGKLRVRQPGRVLYLALEESVRRTASRLRKLTGPSDYLEDLGFVYATDALMGGGIQQIEEYLKTTPCALVVIDTFFAFAKQADRKNTDLIQNEYNIINALRELAERQSCAILLVHHTRKAGGEGIDTVLGTSGVTAACDAIWTLRRQSEGDCLLTVTGREMEEVTYGMVMESSVTSFGWKITGQGMEAVLSAERREIVELLRTDGPQVPKMIAANLKKNPSTVRRLLQMLTQDGITKKDGETYTISGEYAENAA